VSPRPPGRAGADLSRQYVKLCDIADFEDPELLDVLRDLLPERDPLAHAERKVWEFAMCILFLREAGRLTEETEALAVGAGDERIVFWLANHVGRVVATDIYGTGHFAGQEADRSMLEDPAAHAPFPYREDRLEVLWMDGRELDFPDESFDVVFSISSLEHFGAGPEVARAAREINRVLRPGGHAFIATECYVRKHPLNSIPVDLVLRVLSLGRLRRRATLRRRAGVDVFTWGEIERYVVEASGLRLVQPVDRRVSKASWSNLARTRPGRELAPRSGSVWPQILLSFRGSVFTSVSLALVK
jgi:SAM-dependent methyltransferase